MFNEFNRARGRSKIVPKTAKNRIALELIVNDLAKRAGIQDTSSIFFYIEMSPNPKSALRDLDSAIRRGEMAVWEAQRGGRRKLREEVKGLFRMLPIELAEVCWKYGEERYRELILGESICYTPKIESQSTATSKPHRAASAASSTTTLVGSSPTSGSNSFPSSSGSESVPETLAISSSDNHHHYVDSNSTVISPSTSPSQPLVFSFSDPEVSPDSTPMTSPSDSDSEEDASATSVTSCFPGELDVVEVQEMINNSESNSLPNLTFDSFEKPLSNTVLSPRTRISILDSPLQPYSRKTRPVRTLDDPTRASHITSKYLDAGGGERLSPTSKQLASDFPSPRSHLHDDVDVIDDKSDGHEFPSMRIPRVGSFHPPLESYYPSRPSSPAYMSLSQLNGSDDSKKPGAGSSKSFGKKDKGSGVGKEKNVIDGEKSIEMKLVRPPIRPPPTFPFSQQDSGTKRKHRSRGRSTSSSKSRSLSKNSRLPYDSPASTISSLPPTPPLTRSSSVSSFSTTTTVGVASGSTTISSSLPPTRLTFPPTRLPSPPLSQSSITESSIQFPFDLTHQTSMQEVELQSRTGCQYSYPYSQARYQPSSSSSPFSILSSQLQASAQGLQQQYQIQTPRIRMCADSMFWRRLALRNSSRILCGVKIVTVRSSCSGSEDVAGEERNIVLGWPRGLIPLQRSTNDTSLGLGSELETEEEEEGSERLNGKGRRRGCSEVGSGPEVTDRRTRSASFSVTANKSPSSRSSHHLTYHSSSSHHQWSTPLTDLTTRKSIARTLKGREGYLVRRRIFEEERILRRVMCEPVVVYSREKECGDGSGGKLSSSNSSIKSHSKSRSNSRSSLRKAKVEVDSLEQQQQPHNGRSDVEEGKLLSVCWEGRWRTRLMSSW